MSGPDASPDPALDSAVASDLGAEPSDGDASRLTQRIVGAITGADVRLTVLALVAALVVGALFLALSDTRTLDAVTSGAGLGAVLQAAARSVSRAYSALLQGSLGSPGAISETLVAATVLILTGLAVTIPLRAGLFNIGGEGQVIAGGLAGGYVGFAVEGLPLAVHLPLAIVAALLGGAVIGWIPQITEKMIRRLQLALEAKKVLGAFFTKPMTIYKNNPTPWRIIVRQADNETLIDIPKRRGGSPISGISISNLLHQTCCGFA